MSKNNIQKNEDMFGLDLPIINPDGEMEVPNTVEVKATDQVSSYFQENPTVLYSVIFVIIILCIILFIIFKKLLKKRNPMLEYAKQQTKKIKKDQAYISSTNKLETPDSLTDCIRTFIDRTK